MSTLNTWKHTWKPVLAPSISEVVCPGCGEKATASFPLTFLDIKPEDIASYQDHYARHGKRVEINTDHNGRVILWFFPDFFNRWPSGDQGWPGSMTLCECDHCGFRGKHRYSTAPLIEQWGLDATTRISYCPICGQGPWSESYSVDELAGSYSICEDCGCEYGCDDTPEIRERWLEEAKQRLTTDELNQRKARMIMTWNAPLKPAWMYCTPIPIDAEGGMCLK